MPTTPNTPWARVTARRTAGITRSALRVASALGVSLAFIGSAAGQTPEPAPPLRILVEDRSGMWSADEPLPTLYLASSANAWNPGADPSNDSLTLVGGEAPGAARAWEFLVPREVASRRDFQFKFTRGEWATVEVAENGSDISNRTLEGQDPEHAAEIRLVLHGFADQRGTRWQHLAPAGAKSSVTGHLDVFTVHSLKLDTNRAVRVWLPPDYFEPASGERRYPVMYMLDGQNVFDAATSFAGEWGMDETATALITEGAIEPLIVVGIDNGGPDRAAEYNPPYTSYQGRQNSGDRHLDFLVDELMPLINERYRTRTGPEHTGLGGSSFGGNATLYALSARPGVFSRALVESPAVIVSERKLLEHLRSDTGELPRRVFIGVGSAESAARADAASYVDAVRELEAILRTRGLTDERLRFVVVEGAMHNEQAWAARLPEAMRFLWGH